MNCESEARTLLEVKRLTKRFAGNVALEEVDFDVRAGEVHALLGENGAGKSTLIKTLAGVHRHDEGEIRLKGRVVDPVVDKLPITFIHQDLGLVELDVGGRECCRSRGLPAVAGMDFLVCCTHSRDCGGRTNGRRARPQRPRRRPIRCGEDPSSQLRGPWR